MKRSIVGALLSLGTCLATASTAPVDLNLRCGQNESIRARLNNASTGSEQRLDELRELGRDLEALRKEVGIKSSNFPRNFLINCLKKKAELVTLSAKQASDTLRDRYEWLVAMGDIAHADGNVTGAFDLYTRALEKKPGEHDLRRKLAVVWKDRVFQIVKKGDLPKGDPKALDNLYKQTLTILRPVLEDPDAPASMKTEFFLLQGLLLDAMNRFAEAIGSYRQALVHDPKNRLALLNIGTWAYDRAQWAEARQAYEKLAPQDRPLESVQLRLLELQVRDGDWNALATSSKEALDANPSSNDLKAYRALAFLKNGQANEAERLAKAVLRAAPKHRAARRTMAMIHLERGLSASKAESPGIALAEYDQAYKYDTTLTELRAAMGQLIFEFRKKEGFRRQAALLTDLKRVVELLDPVVNEKSRAVEIKTLEAHFESAFFIGNKAAAARSCARYDADYGSLASAEQVVNCADCLKSQGQIATARALLKKAIDGGRFGGQERAMIEVLNRLN